MNKNGWKDFPYEKNNPTKEDLKKYDFCSCGLSLCYRPKRNKKAAFYKFKGRKMMAKKKTCLDVVTQTSRQYSDTDEIWTVLEYLAKKLDEIIEETR